MRDLREFVEDYIAQLPDRARDGAWHSLVEAGPAALPHVVEAFKGASDLAVKIALVQVASEYRSAAAIPFLQGCLGSDQTQIWKAALDGLVTLGGTISLDVLTVERETARSEKRQWIDEAVEQISADTNP